MKKTIKNLYLKEVYQNYLISPLGFIFCALFVGIASWLFIQDLFLINQASLTPLFNLLPFLFMFFLPAITMNLFAEEKKSKTWEILLTLPVSEKEVIIAKFLAAFSFTAFSLLLTTPLLVIIMILGQPDLGLIASGYLGSLLLAGCYIATGIFFSSITNSAIISLITSVSLLLINFFISQQNILTRMPTIIQKIISAISLNNNFTNFVQGNLVLTNLIFYLSWIGFFIWLTIVSLKSRDV